MKKAESLSWKYSPVSCAFIVCGALYEYFIQQWLTVNPVKYSFAPQILHIYNHRALTIHTAHYRPQFIKDQKQSTQPIKKHQKPQETDFPKPAHLCFTWSEHTAHTKHCTGTFISEQDHRGI